MGTHHSGRDTLECHQVKTAKSHDDNQEETVEYSFIKLTRGA